MSSVLYWILAILVFLIAVYFIAVGQLKGFRKIGKAYKLDKVNPAKKQAMIKRFVWIYIALIILAIIVGIIIGVLSK